MNINSIEKDRDKVKLLQALHTLRSSHDFEMVVEFFEQQLKQIDKSLRSEQKNFLCLQGKAQILEGFLELVEASSDLLRTFKQDQ